MNSENQLIEMNHNDFNDLFCHLVDIPYEQITGLAMQRVLQCIFTLMEKKNVNLSPKIFKRFISAIITEFEKNADAASSTEHRQLVANILECIQIQVTKFPSAEGKSLLEELWSLCLNEEHVHPLAAQILVQLYDDFVRDLGLERFPELLVVIQQLLQSKEKEERQSAYFLMHKLKEIFDDVTDVIKCIKQQWSEYIDIVEHLEEQQMHSNLIRKHSRLTSKIDDCKNFKMKVTYFSPLRCEIISCKMDFISANYVLMAIVQKLRNLQRSQHGCLRLFCLYGICFRDEICDFYSTEYGVDVSLVQNGKDLEAIQTHLLDKLKCETSEEKSYLLKVTTESFVYRIKNWSEIEELQLSPVDLLQQGGLKIIENLAYLLENCNQRLHDENVLPAFIASLKNYPIQYVARRIAQYAAKHLNIEEQNSIFLDIVSDHLKYKGDVLYEIFLSDLKAPVHQVLPIILDNLPLSEDAMIEATYRFCMDVIRHTIYFTLDYFIHYALRQSDSYVKEVGDELIRINKELCETHPNCRNNSKENRLKFYIAKALLILAKKYQCSDELWSALFSQNDQLNITCMYELIVAKSLPSLDLLLERLESISTLEPNQQVSLLSVTNVYLHLNGSKFDSEQHQKVFTILLSLTMRDESQVRQFAKLILKALITMCKESSLPVPLCNLWQTTFEGDVANISIEPQLQAHLFPNEMISFSFKSFYERHRFCSYAFLMSNVKPSNISREASIIFHNFREAIKSALCEHQHETIVSPMTNIYPKPVLVPKNDVADLIVVAALIDDSTTLNDLIQTCKVVGVRTLILSDSTNLSANSKDLNIVKVKPEELQDYLRGKKREKYNIVATQNTGENANFVNFSFAKKTILLFGPEQNDTLENLRDFLDNTVEIPQNDFLKAQQLFIFKYYQQYLAKD